MSNRLIKSEQGSSLPRIAANGYSKDNGSKSVRFSTFPFGSNSDTADGLNFSDFLTKFLQGFQQSHDLVRRVVMDKPYSQHPLGFVPQLFAQF